MSDTTAETSPVKQEKPLTLEAILTAMQAFDDGVEFDPAKVVGDLKEKIDAIRHVMSRFEFHAEWATQQAAPFLKLAKSAKAKAARLEEYVKFQMKAKGYTDLPGVVYRAHLQNNNPALQITQPECTALDFTKYPNYVKQIRHYEWDREAIKTAMIAKRNAALDAAAAAGNILPDAHEFTCEALPFAKLTIGRQLRFYPNAPEPKEKK